MGGENLLFSVRFGSDHRMIQFKGCTRPLGKRVSPPLTPLHNIVAAIICLSIEQPFHRTYRKHT
ncbi:hypothetical protein HanRHA438_Chr04g0199341 [Helianthus annuus]|nr:hypothetical protein HanRHA438_Chr04g0199341 [Helianthus annuus]